jgi:hypothetical protein
MRKEIDKEENTINSHKISPAEYTRRRQLEYDARMNQYKDDDLRNMPDDVLRAHVQGSRDFMSGSSYGSDRANRKVSVASVNSDIERHEMTTKERQKKDDREGVQTPSKNDRIKAYQKTKGAILKAAKARIESRKENRSNLNAMSAMVIFTAFTVAIISDVLDIVLDGTVVGYPFSLLANFGICPFIGFLWWSLGVDSSNNRLKKGGQRMFASLGIETIIDFFPTLIIWCFINLLDYLGYLDNKDWIKTLSKNRAKNILPLDSK